MNVVFKKNPGTITDRFFRIEDSVLSSGVKREDAKRK